MNRRNKLVIVLGMPVAVALWLIGWVHYYFSSTSITRTRQTQIARPKQAKQKESELQFIVLTPKQQHAK
jgi:hypothetical protein